MRNAPLAGLIESHVALTSRDLRAIRSSRLRHGDPYANPPIFSVALGALGETDHG